MCLEACISWHALPVNGICTEYIYIHTYVYACIQTYTHAFIDTCMGTCIHIFICVHTHKHTHTQPERERERYIYTHASMDRWKVLTVHKTHKCKRVEAASSPLFCEKINEI